MVQLIDPLVKSASHRIIDHIVGHDDIKSSLLGAQKQDHLASTFLFVGPDGVGRKKVALALTQSLVCEDSIPGGCGQCGPCLRVHRGSSEALLFLKPEKNIIKIEQTTTILEFLSLRAISKSRVVIIDSAHLMHASAANILLKVFEEPPERTYFFMIAPSSQQVLPTLKSRSQIVRFSPIPLKEMQYKSKAPEWALRASQGSFSKLAGFQEESERNIRDAAKQFLEIWINERSSFAKPEWRERLKDRASSINLSIHMASLIRDALFVKVAGIESSQEFLVNIDRLDLIRELTTRLDQGALQKLFQNSFRLEQALHANRDVTLSFEEFWLS